VDAALLDAEPVLIDGEGDLVRQARLNLHEAVRRLCRPAGDAAMACSLITIALRWLGAPEGAECAVQADLLRDLFGNPFRPTTPIGQERHDGTVLKLAQAANDDRPPSGELDPARLGVLVDALEEVGCTDVALLSHLRGPGPHCRGCFALDTLLGRG
jgi:hypothetical protein